MRVPVYQHAPAIGCTTIDLQRGAISCFIGLPIQGKVSTIPIHLSIGGSYATWLPSSIHPKWSKPDS